MMKTMTYFQEYKNEQKKQLNRQIVLNETKEQLSFTHSGQEKVYTFLKEETEKLPPYDEMLDVCIMIKFDNNIMNQHIVQLKIKHGVKRSTINAHFDYIEDGSLYITAITSHEQPSCTAWSMTELEKDELLAVYQNFLHIIKEMPAYRLYFATMDLEIDDDEVYEWISLS